MHFWSTDRASCAVPLSLNINSVESESVFVYHPIYPAVARSSKLGGGIFTGAPIAHGDKEPDYDLLEEARAILKDPLNEFVAERGIQG